jgi:hypothetical protein
MVKITKLINFLMVFMHFSIQFWILTRIRIRNLDKMFRIHADPDPQHWRIQKLFGMNRF